MDFYWLSAQPVPFCHNHRYRLRSVLAIAFLWDNSCRRRIFLEPFAIPHICSPSLDDRMELIPSWGIVSRDKKKLCFGRKDDLATRTEVRIDQDVFDRELALAGKSKKERAKIEHVYN